MRTFQSSWADATDRVRLLFASTLLLLGVLVAVIKRRGRDRRRWKLAYAGIHIAFVGVVLLAVLTPADELAFGLLVILFLAQSLAAYWRERRK